MTKNKMKRVAMSLFGVIICAISVGMFKLSAFGVDPFQTLMSGLYQLIPINFGTLYVIVNVCLLTFALIADRHYIGLATFINLFLLGYITQFTYEQLQLIFINPSLVVRVIFLLVAIIIICFGSSLYMTADLGVSTYDAVAIIFSKTWQLGQFKYIRVMTDLVCVMGGAIIYLIGGGTMEGIGGLIGIGTIITAFFMGPLVDYFNRTFSQPFLEK